MITEVLGGLGSWSLKLTDEAPDEVLQQLGFLGHVVVVRGKVDVAATSSSLLAAARYVGVLRERSKDRRTLEGDGMLFWLGDEDGKGKVLESPVNLSGASLSAAVAAVLPPAVHTGTINSAAGTYTGKHQFETPRAALDTITAAFDVEYRVNGDATLDVGTQAQLYRTTPATIIAAKNAGADLDLTSLGANVEVEESIRDYSTRILLLGSSYDDGTTTTLATGSADAPSVPYKDPWGNTYQATRMISESGTTTGSVAQRAQLQLNRFNRAATALRVTATDYAIEGNTFRVGDNAYVYDPANGIVDASRTIDFRGEVIHPDVVRISGATWPVDEGHTVAFRTNAGAWVDLTPWVVWESGGGEITVGDLPKSLTSAGGNPVQDRADALPDATIPTAPTGLSLSTFAAVDPKGQNQAFIRASWSAPTLNTDGTVITDLSSYLARWRVLGRPAWQSTAVGVTQLDIQVTIDTDYEVQVAAVDRSGHVSAYTASVTIHASVDTTAPNAPSDPAVTSYLGQLRIAWDGKDNTAAAMPNDFNRVDVHVSATSGFTPSTTTLVSSLSTAGVAYATAPYGATRYVKLVAYDNAGNASAPSGQVAGATVQVADGDVASLSVGKLTAGTMSADVVVGGRFATALTGLRVEMNSLGFQKFAADNSLLVSITGTEALLTGIYKTAATGRRIEIGAAGAVGEIDFLAPDGTKTFVRAWTESAGIESIQFGIAGTGGNVNLPNSLWNRINYNNDASGGGGVGYASYRANKHEFLYGKTTGFFHVMESADNIGGGGFDRLFVSKDTVNLHTNYFQVNEDDGTQRFQCGGNNGDILFRYGDGDLAFWIDNNVGKIRMYPNDAGESLEIGPRDTPEISPIVKWLTAANPTDGFVRGAGIKYVYNSTTFGDGRLEVRNVVDNNFDRIFASAFVVSSDERAKKNIRDAGPGQLAKLRGLRARIYQRDTETDRGEHLGLVAQEAEQAAPEIVVDGGDSGKLIDLYAGLTLALAGIAELADQVDAIRKGGKP